MGIEVLTHFLMEASPFTVDKLKKSRAPIGQRKKFSLLHKMTIRFSTFVYTANVLSVEYADICLCSEFKNKHWLFLHAFVCNGQQMFSRCFYFESNTKFIEK